MKKRQRLNITMTPDGTVTSIDHNGVDLTPEGIRDITNALLKFTGAKTFPCGGECLPTNCTRPVFQGFTEELPGYPKSGDMYVLEKDVLDANGHVKFHAFSTVTYCSNIGWFSR